MVLRNKKKMFLKYVLRIQPGLSYWGFVLVLCMFLLHDIHFFSSPLTISKGGILCLTPISWTFQEYFAHRWLMHGRIQYLKKSHYGHHLNPSDRKRLFIPIFFTILFGTFNFFIVKIVSSYEMACLNFCMNAVCYASFEWSHYVCHSKSDLWFTSKIRNHHLQHHFVKKRDVNFGFTSACWDILLGTYNSPSNVSKVLLIPIPVLPFILDYN